LRKALDILFTEGLDGAARRHALLAEATRQAVTRWAEGQVLAFNIIKPGERANSITCVLMQGQDPRPLLDYCRWKCGVIPGQGIGDLTGRAIRIAHMGHVNAPMVIGALGAIEMGLAALGIPHGRGGVQAAVEYLASQVKA
jgi:alanine-glyoxylate transaminase/serine-glyoxylate transaminase/serine-pyruvate transaminase